MKTTYRSPFFTAWIHIYAYALIGYTILIIITSGFVLDLMVCVIGLLGNLFITFLLTFLAVRYFVIEVDSQSIRGYNCWGVYSSVDLDQIEHIKNSNILLYKYIRVYYKGSSKQKRFAFFTGGPLWIPLFLDKMDEFKDMIIKNAPENNPLREYFEMEN